MFSVATSLFAQFEGVAHHHSLEPCSTGCVFNATVFIQFFGIYFHQYTLLSFRATSISWFSLPVCVCDRYVHQLYILVNCFLRPLRMAASSKKPPISHDDVSSIFLNSETIMFLHEIFHQGLKARIANWPTLVLADLFDILLPMLNIYQEFVRNHQYSLQVLANCKQNRDFDKLLKQYESNAACEGRMLETFLTYPMFQIPRYIITLHELLAHTPHEHVERKSLEFAKSKLEELS
ncbi:Ras-specific guanine nucleotide-releasing factor 2, partial [Goodea atripinnis]